MRSLLCWFIVANLLYIEVPCAASFILKKLLSGDYLSSGNFIQTKRELIECIQDEDKTVLELSISLQKYSDYDFDRAFSILFNWCQNALSRI